MQHTLRSYLQPPFQPFQNQVQIGYARHELPTMSFSVFCRLASRSAIATKWCPNLRPFQLTQGSVTCIKWCYIWDYLLREFWSSIHLFESFKFWTSTIMPVSTWSSNELGYRVIRNSFTDLLLLWGARLQGHENTKLFTSYQMSE